MSHCSSSVRMVYNLQYQYTLSSGLSRVLYTFHHSCNGVPMSTSLKALIPAIAQVLEMNPATLYERQRALVRSGLLKTKSGRGPGSGVRASADSVAILLIA